MAVRSSRSEGQQSAQWFPSWFIWPLFFMTSALRVYYVLQPKNWWIMHPDEVYQTMEVAHSEMYGYGFRAYEYNPPPEILPNTPHIRKMELQHGMAALRSYILPHLYVMVTWLLELVGLHFTPFLTWKVAHTLVASTLPLAIHRYVTVVFRSHDTACLAAILCVTSAQLHVLGTHTLVNSILSAPVFWALAHVHTLINPPSCEGETDGNHNSIQNKSLRANSSNQASGRNKAQTNGYTNKSATKPGSVTHRASKNKGKQKSEKNGAVQKQSSTPSGTVARNGSFKPELSVYNDLTVKSDSNKGSSAVKPGENGISDKQTQNEPAKNGNNHVSPFNVGVFLKNLGAGFVLGVCVYIRIDLAALMVIALLPHWRPFCTCYGYVVVCGCGALCGITVGVMEDFWCYGWGVLTPYNWYKFNVEKDYSSILFGKNDFYLYILEIFFDNIGIILLSAVCCVSAVLMMLPSWISRTFRKESDEDLSLDVSSQRGVVRTSVSWLLLLVLYSSKGHKELRFVHNVIILILITWAAFLQSAVINLTSSHQIQKRVLVVGVVLFAISQWHDVVHLTDNPERGGNKMGFKLAGDTQDINQCLYYISSRDDVTGVFFDRNLYATGGYPLLHKNIPIFTIFGKHFHEYRLEDRMIEPAKNLFGPQRNISVAYVPLFSNFLTSLNSQYVFKFVLEDPRYNYIVGFHARDFSFFGLGDPVYRCRTYKVYRRPTKPSAKQKRMMKEAMNIDLPSVNATILLHEADTLFYHGAWARARERFRLALRVDPTLVGVYIPLAMCYIHEGDEDGYMTVMEECYAKFGQEKCEKRRPALVDLNDIHF